MIESLRQIITAIKSNLGQLDAALVSAQVDERELPSLPMATALVELDKLQERISKTSARIIDLARRPPQEPSLFPEDADDEEAS